MNNYEVKEQSLYLAFCNSQLILTSCSHIITPFNYIQRYLLSKNSCSDSTTYEKMRNKYVCNNYFVLDNNFFKVLIIMCVINFTNASKPHILSYPYKNIYNLEFDNEDVSSTETIIIYQKTNIKGKIMHNL